MTNISGEKSPKPIVFALVSLITGIMAFLLGLVPFIGLTVGAVAVIFGILAIRKKQSKGMSITGTVLGGVGFLASLVTTSALIVGLSSLAPNEFDDTSESYSSSESSQQEETPLAIPQPSPDISYSGSGDTILEIALPAGPDSIGVGAFTHTGSSNFSVWSLNNNLEQDDLLVNTIGNYSGTVLFNMSSSTTITALEIGADGPWTLTLKDVRTLRELTQGSENTGQGDDVLVYYGEATVADISHSGEHNFAVWSYGDENDLLINEIGPYSGQVRWQAGPSIIEVTADGAWTISLK